jgi:hypothetical protein
VAILLGDKNRFAVEVGEWRGRLLRRVDLWAAGQWLTCDDNTAYVPQLRLGMQADCARLRSIADSPAPFAGLPPAAVHRQLLTDEDGGLREQCWFLHWGPTTDNVLAHLIRDENHLLITLEFWRKEHLRLHPEHAGAIFAVEIEADELARILQNAAAALDQD